MAFTYSDWDQQATAAARLARLRLYIQELSDRLTAEIAADGKSKATAVFERRIAALESKRDELEQRAGRSGSRVSRVRLLPAEDGC